MNDNFSEKLRHKIDDAEAFIREYASSSITEEDVLGEAMCYSLYAGGKRLRPILMLETYRIFGGSKKEIISPFACAVEMIHTYSLIHDDLPAMDNDDFRRGKPTNHKVYGEAMAILAGDGLLNYAVETASKAFRYCENINEYRAVSEALSRLFHYSGKDGMIGGQVLDMLAEDGKKKKNEAFFVNMYGRKTGGLIKAAFEVGAILAGAKEMELTQISKVGEAFGLLFQLQDDILDVSGDEAKLGKPLHSDEKNNKYTYFKLLGREKALQLIEEKNTYIIDSLTDICSKNKDYDGFIIDFVKYLKNRDR